MDWSSLFGGSSGHCPNLHCITYSKECAYFLWHFHNNFCVCCVVVYDLNFPSYILSKHRNMTKLLQEHKPKLCCIMQNTYFPRPRCNCWCSCLRHPKFFTLAEKNYDAIFRKTCNSSCDAVVYTDHRVVDICRIAFVSLGSRIHCVSNRVCKVAAKR